MLRVTIFLLLASLGVFGWMKRAAAQETATGFVPITLENVAQLELGYALPRSCRNFSPDGTLLITERDVYDTNTGQLRFSTNGYVHTFSNDGTLLAVREDGVYDVVTGERLFQTPSGLYLESFNLSFHPDNTMIAGSGRGVWAIPSGDEIFSFPERLYSGFSPDGQWLALMGDGVYRVETWERVFEISELFYFPVFSPDSSLLALSYDAVYETSTWEQRFSIRVDDGIGYPDPFFSPDGKFFVAGRRIYDTESGEQVFQFVVRQYYGLSFSPDSSLVSIYGDAIYSTENWERRFDISRTVVFSPDGTLYSVEGDSIYSTATGAKLFARDGEFNPNMTLLVRDADNNFDDTCLIYGSPENQWAYRSGLVRADSPINVRTQPNGDVLRTAQGEIPVFARTTDSSWFKITPFDWGWVSASAVQVLSMPDGVPVENP